jgi:hypothetical protein
VPVDVVMAMPTVGCVVVVVVSKLSHDTSSRLVDGPKGVAAVSSFAPYRGRERWGGDVASRDEEYAS